jgi:hypothetical protein
LGEQNRFSRFQLSEVRKIPNVRHAPRLAKFDHQRFSLQLRQAVQRICRCFVRAALIKISCGNKFD